MREWLHLAAEVIVVDSHSTDGTVDFLRTELKHPKVRYLTHPPGLYASWNFGVTNVQTEFVYLSTAGDTISREGIEILLKTMTSFHCDVALSKPMFRATGGPAEDLRWPIDDVIDSLRITAPRKLGKLEAVLFAATHPEAAFPGSVASDLFRTDTLKRFPFPTDFGVIGDGAWAWMHAAELSWAAVPQKFSTFLLHPSGASADERKSLQQSRSPDDVLVDAMQSWRRSGIISDADLEKLRWNELMQHLRSYLDAKRGFDNNRRSQLPWWLNPSAWITRSRRDTSWTKLQESKRAALAQCADNN
jgi:hypothetical protein